MAKQQNPHGLRKVRCCGTCRHRQGWADNLWCGLHQELNASYLVQPYTICNDYVPDDDTDLALKDTEDGRITAGR